MANEMNKVPCGGFKVGGGLSVDDGMLTPNFLSTFLVQDEEGNPRGMGFYLEDLCYDSIIKSRKSIAFSCLVDMESPDEPIMIYNFNTHQLIDVQISENETKIVRETSLALGISDKGKFFMNTMNLQDNTLTLSLNSKSWIMTDITTFQGRKIGIMQNNK